MAYETGWCSWQGPTAPKLKLAFANPYPHSTMKNPTHTWCPHTDRHTHTHTYIQILPPMTSFPYTAARPEIPLRPPFQTVSTVLLSSHIKGHYWVTLLLDSSHACNSSMQNVHHICGDSVTSNCFDMLIELSRVERIKIAFLYKIRCIICAICG